MRYAIVVDCTRGFMSKNLKHQIEVISTRATMRLLDISYSDRVLSFISQPSQLVVVSPPGPRLPEKPLTFKLTEEQVRIVPVSHCTLLFYDVL